jgi:hypothetical protein
MEGIVQFGALANRKPAEVIAEARERANAVNQIVEEKGLFQKIGQKKHYEIEAWQLLGYFYQVSAKIVQVTPLTGPSENVLDPEPVVVGFNVKAQAVHVPSGAVVTEVEAFCTRDEENWDERPEYKWDETAQKRVRTGATVDVPLFQVSSMAQTRGMSKALRAALSWVFTLADKAKNYSTTPAAEMGKKPQPTQTQGREPERKPAPAPTPQHGEPQRTTDKAPAGKIGSQSIDYMSSLVRRWSVPVVASAEILRKHGFIYARDITSDHFDQIIYEIQQYAAAHGFPDALPGNPDDPFTKREI